MTPSRIIAHCRALVLLLWSCAAIAAPNTFGQAIAQVTLVEWLLVCVLATLGGVTALLMRISDEVNKAPTGEAAPIKNIPLLAAAQLSGSWTAGLVGFFLCPTIGVSGIAVGIVVPLAAFGGARLLEMGYNKFIKSKVEALP